jgi:hypothetical protein
MKALRSHRQVWYSVIIVLLAGKESAATWILILTLCYHLTTYYKQSCLTIGLSLSHVHLPCNCVNPSTQHEAQPYTIYSIYSSLSQSNINLYILWCRDVCTLILDTLNGLPLSPLKTVAVDTAKSGFSNSRDAKAQGSFNDCWVGLCSLRMRDCKPIFYGNILI